MAAIAVFTQTGRTALLMSKTRPAIPIRAFTPELDTYRHLPMMWGVIPPLVPKSDTLEAMLEVVEEAIMAFTTLQPGQQVVFFSGFPVGEIRPPNIALLYTIGERKEVQGSRKEGIRFLRLYPGRCWSSLCRSHQSSKTCW